MADMGGVGAPWLVFVAAATWRDERDQGPELPRPSIYVGSAVVYSGLAVLAQSERARPVAVALAWAFVVAELLAGRLGADTTPATGWLGLNSPKAVAAITRNSAAARAATARGRAPRAGGPSQSPGVRTQPGTKG